jgi:transposase
LSDRIDVPLELEGFAVTDSELVGGTLEVGVISTLSRACNHCGSLDVEGHGRKIRRIRDRACVYPVVLRWSQRRFACHDCSHTSWERHPEIAGRRSITNRLRRRLFERACNEPFLDVAVSEAVSCYRVVEAFDWHASDELVDPGVGAPRVISLDESAFRKRFRFHTIVSDPERGAVIGLTEGRSQSSAEASLAALDAQVRAGIETVVIDCHWPYRRAIERWLPDARVVADKFHVLRAVDNAAARVRKRHGRRRMVRGRDGGISRQNNPRFIPAVFRNRWTFMKRSHKLTDDEALALIDIFESIPEIAIAWHVKEEFAAIYESPDRREAERRLDSWAALIEKLGIAEFTGVWRTLRLWREPILAYFEDPVTNAFAEGITNKIKVMKRRSYGFRNEQRYRHKVLLTCGHARSRGRATHRSS